MSEVINISELVETNEEVKRESMPRLQLKYKPKNIRIYEESNGPVTDLLDASVNNLNKLVCIGNGNCSVEVADDILETFFDNGGDIIEGVAQVIEALQRGGFLPRDLALAKVMRAQMKNQMLKLGQELESKVE